MDHTQGTEYRTTYGCADQKQYENIRYGSHHSTLDLAFNECARDTAGRALWEIDDSLDFENDDFLEVHPFNSQLNQHSNPEGPFGH